MACGSCSRREFLAASAAVIGSARTAWAFTAGVVAALDTIEARVGGRVGVYALDTGSGRYTGHRADERFAMCSTFKWVLAASVLARVDQGECRLADVIRYGQSDLLSNAPVTTSHVAEGELTVRALAEAAVTVSDNTAANLLLATVGGPAGLTAYIRAQGDTVTRLDRIETALNANEPGDARDTTTPRAMAGLLQRVLCGHVLRPESRELVLGWMRACETGRRRLRAGLPADWVVGDKTGGGMRNAVNDVAIAWPPGKPPIIVACYLSDSSGSFTALEAAQASVGELVARAFTTGALEGTWLP
jgi:beta-lactamase class A